MNLLPVKPTPRVLRQFAGAWLVFFLIFSATALWKRHNLPVSCTFAVVALFGIVGLIRLVQSIAVHRGVHCDVSDWMADESDYPRRHVLWRDNTARIFLEDPWTRHLAVAQSIETINLLGETRPATTARPIPKAILNA